MHAHVCVRVHTGSMPGLPLPLLPIPFCLLHVYSSLRSHCPYSAQPSGLLRTDWAPDYHFWQIRVCSFTSLSTKASSLVVNFLSWLVPLLEERFPPGIAGWFLPCSLLSPQGHVGYLAYCRHLINMTDWTSESCLSSASKLAAFKMKSHPSAWCLSASISGACLHSSHSHLISPL